MGFYIEDTKEYNKVDWLEKNGLLVSEQPCKQLNKFFNQFDCDNSFIFVCLIDNGDFQAAGIAYERNELRRFLYDDGRDKKLYKVPKEKIRQVCPWIFDNEGDLF